MPLSEGMTSPTEQFRSARDFLLEHRTDYDTAYAQFRWQRAERAEATAAGRAPVVSVSDTLQPDPFVVGFFSPITDRVPSTRNRP